MTSISLASLCRRIADAIDPPRPAPVIINAPLALARAEYERAVRRHRGQRVARAKFRHETCEAMRGELGL